MPVTRINFVKPIMDAVSQRLCNNTQTIVWYGRDRTMAIVSDVLKIRGKKISYYLSEDADKIGKRLNLSYANNIPLCNKYIKFDIGESDKK